MSVSIFIHFLFSRYAYNENYVYMLLPCLIAQ